MEDTQRYVRLADKEFCCPRFHNITIRNGLVDGDRVLDGAYHAVPWNPIEMAAYEEQLREWRRPAQRFLRWLLRHDVGIDRCTVSINAELRPGNRVGRWLEAKGVLTAFPPDQRVDVENMYVRYRSDQQYPAQMFRVMGARLAYCVFQPVMQEAD